MDLTFLVSLVTSQGPWGLVALLGLILGFLHLNRYHRPAMMVLIGSSLLLLSSVGFVVMQIIQLELHSDGDHNSAMRMSAFIRTCVEPCPCSRRGSDARRGVRRPQI